MKLTKTNLKTFKVEYTLGVQWRLQDKTMTVQALNESHAIELVKQEEGRYGKVLYPSAVEYN